MCKMALPSSDGSGAKTTLNIKAAGTSVVNACGVALCSDGEARIFHL